MTSWSSLQVRLYIVVYKLQYLHFLYYGFDFVVAESSVEQLNVAGTIRSIPCY
jgi:hypothetical protein